MDWTEKVIPFHLHPLGFIDAFVQFGANLSDLLQAAEVKECALKSAQEKISYQQFIHLIRAGIKLCRRPALGLLVSRHFKWYYHGLTGMAILSSSTFNQAGLAFHRYSCLAQPYYMPYRCQPFYYLDNRLRVLIPIEHLITTPAMDADVYRFEVEFRLGLLFRMLHQFGERQSGFQGSSQSSSVNAAVIELNISAPPYDYLYREMTNSNIRFNCEHARIILPVTALDMEGDILRKAVYKQALDYCDAELSKMIVTAPITEQVRALLLENIPRYPTIGNIAEKMELTTRTLARKLSLENTTFTEILNQVRSEVAIYFLRSTQLSVDDIAECMGFAETANFRQAFRRWTGHSSNSFRAPLPGAPQSSRLPQKPQARVAEVN